MSSGVKFPANCRLDRRAYEAPGAIGMGGCVQGFLGSLLQPETGRAALARRIFCAPEVRWQAR